jgi:hypothetical protein
MEKLLDPLDRLPFSGEILSRTAHFQSAQIHWKLNAKLLGET